MIIQESNEEIIHPKDVKFQLYPHQLRLVKRMIEIESGERKIKFEKYEIDTNYLIFGDKVGSGKTLTMITLILLNDTVKKLNFFVYGSPLINIKIMDDNYEYKNMTLVIVPNIIISHWINEFEKVPSLKVSVYKSKKTNIDDDTDVVLIQDSLFFFFCL